MLKEECRQMFLSFWLLSSDDLDMLNVMMMCGKVEQHINYQ